MANELDYSQYGFDELVAQLQERLIASGTAWTDIYPSGTGQMLIEFLAYVCDMMGYNIERTAQEAFIGTAINKTSVINLVKLLNYNPKRKTSASGNATFSVSSPHGTVINIPKWTEIQTTTGTTFVTTEEASISAVGTSVKVPIAQGTRGTYTFTSGGTANQTFTLNDTDIENTHVYLTVGGVTGWTAVSSFFASEPTDKHYKLSTDYDDVVIIMFGNDVNGRIPPAGDAIVIDYVKSDGADGNVYSADKIVTVNDTIYDSTITAVTVAVTNEYAVVGGDDAEDIEEIRYEAPRVFATGDRAVTKADYISILENYAGIGSANAWGEQEEYPDNDAPATAINVVKLCILLTDWYTTSTQATFESTLSTYLRTKSPLTVKYEYVEPKIYNIIIEFSEVKTVPGYSLTNVQSTIESTLAAEFALGTTSKIGTDKKFSNLVRSIDELPSVSFHHMEVKVYHELDADTDGITYTGTAYATPLKTSEVEIYSVIGETEALIASDDGVGGFTSEDSNYELDSTCTIDYNTGEINLVFDTIPSGVDTIYAQYKQDEQGDIITGYDGVAKLHEVVVTSITVDEDL